MAGCSGTSGTAVAGPSGSTTAVSPVVSSSSSALAPGATMDPSKLNMDDQVEAGDENLLKGKDLTPYHIHTDVGTFLVGGLDRGTSLQSGDLIPNGFRAVAFSWAWTPVATWPAGTTPVVDMSWAVNRVGGGKLGGGPVAQFPHTDQGGFAVAVTDPTVSGAGQGATTFSLLEHNNVIYQVNLDTAEVLVNIYAG